MCLDKNMGHDSVGVYGTLMSMSSYFDFKIRLFKVQQHLTSIDQNNAVTLMWKVMNSPPIKWANCPRDLNQTWVIAQEWKK